MKLFTSGLIKNIIDLNDRCIYNIAIMKKLFVKYELNQIGIKIDMYRQEYRFTPAFAFIQAV